MNLLSDDITKEDIEKYLKKYGKKGQLVISELGKRQPFMDAINSDAGKLLLGDGFNQMDVYLNNIIAMCLDSPNSTEKIIGEVAKFKSLHDILTEWSDKIISYHRKTQEIKTT